jgi:hypothetical protein
VIEDDQVGGGGVRGTADFVQLAFPQQGCGVGLGRPLKERAHDARPGALRQFAQF